MRCILVSLFIFLYSSSYSQTATGSWYGKADAIVNGNHNNYLTELIIKQKGNEVEGIFGYYFRDGYKSFFIRGKYDKKTRKFVIRKIPLTYFRSASIDGVDCMMDFYGTLMVSKVESSISGYFVSDPKYKFTCPEIRINGTLDITETNQDSLIRNSVARKVWQPRAEDVVISNARADSASVKPDTSTTSAEQLQNLVKTFEKRETVLSKEVEVASDSVRISFYDNGDIDGDSISVFLNKVPVLTKQVLTSGALDIYFKLDSTRDINEVTMFAENLGKYPPNTALMVVNDGEHRYEAYLSSSLTQNASVRLKRKKENK